MKILMVVPEWPPDVIGGGGAVYARIAQYLVSQGHRVTVCYGDFRNVHCGVERWESGLRIVPLVSMAAPRGMAWAMSALPPTFPGIIKLKKTIAEGWDVAHLHGVGFPLIDLAARLLHRHRIPYAFTAHGVPVSPLRRGMIFKTAMTTYLKHVFSWTLRNAHAVTAVSRAISQHPIFEPRTVAVIYNGIDAIEPRTPETESNVLNLASLSRLSKNKGLDVAIEAVALLHREHYPVTLEIWGADGGEEASLRELVRTLGAEQAISFRGIFLPKQRQAVLSRAGAVVMPSRVEAFGLVAIEAMAAGVPLISTAVDGLSEIVDESCAVIVGVDDVGALCEAVKNLLRRENRERIIAGGLKRASQFLWPASLASYEVMLRSATLDDNAAHVCRSVESAT